MAATLAPASASTSPNAQAVDSSVRRAQVIAAADAYLDALAKKDFSLIPYAEDVVLRAPVAPGGVHAPLVGRETLRTLWWAPVVPALGAVQVIERYVSDDLSGVCVAAEVGILGLARPLRVVDRFRISAEGKIVEQENHFDPRDVTNPGWDADAPGERR